MKKTTVYDWPTRIFHWLFVLGFATALSIAKLLDDDSAAYPIHMMVGLTLAFSVLLRIFWGFVGSRYARFASFSLHPAKLFGYLGQLINGKGERELGHNPASSWAALIMMFCALGLAATGYGMTAGLADKDFFEDFHDFFAHLFLFTALAHVGGIAFHTLRHRDWIGLSMLNGRKTSVPGGTGISQTYLAVGLLGLGLVAAFAITLAKNYNPQSQALTLGGTVLQLGEAGEEVESFDED
jgi:cytochrome b